MPNITISIPEELYKRMKARPEIKWSEVVRISIRNYLEKHPSKEMVDITEIKRIIEESNVDLDKISVAEAEAYYEEMRELEWKRTSSTQTS